MFGLRSFFIFLFTLAFPFLALAAETDAKRSPVPNRETIEELQGVIREFHAEKFKDSEGNIRQAALVDELMKAFQTEKDVSSQYVLLLTAQQAAQGMEDWSQVAWIIDEIEKRFEVDGYALKNQLLEEAAKQRSTDAAVEHNLTCTLLNQARVANFRNDTATALSFVKSAERIAKRQRFLPQIQLALQYRKNILDTKKLRESIQNDEESLEKNPDNAQLHQKVGEYLCFHKADWETGLPHLASGSNAITKELAQKETDRNTLAAEFLDIADGWWNLAEKEVGLAQQNLRFHAAELYKGCLSWNKGLKRTQLEQRIMLGSRLGDDDEAKTNLLLGKPKLVIFDHEGKHSPRLLQRFSVTVIAPRTSVTILLQPETLADTSVLFFDQNAFRDWPLTDFSPSVCQRIHEFMFNGGDCIILENYGAEHMDPIAKLGQLTIKGTVKKGCQPSNPIFAKRLQAWNVSESDLQKLEYWNYYDKYDKNSLEFAFGNGLNRPIGLVIPYGKGRLVLVGTWKRSTLHQKFIQATFEMLGYY